jgi:hypothetical protein
MGAGVSMKRIILLFALCLVVSAVFAQDTESDSSPGEPGNRGFISNLFFTGQFGGGTMASLGAGIAFLDNVVRPEVLLGYTATGGYTGFSVNAKLNARIVALPINDWFGMYASIGTSFTFFSADAEIVSAFLVAQEFEFRNVLDIPSLLIYFEEDFFIVPTTEGNMLFQLAIGFRASVF